METLNVFCDHSGRHGNPVGIILDTDRRINQITRQQTAKESGYSEVVFVNSIGTGDISIFSPQREITFAGHAAIGAASYLAHHTHHSISQLISMGSPIDTWVQDNQTWVSCTASVLPQWHYQQLNSVSQLESLKPSHTQSYQHTIIWAWLDQSKGIIRARTFAPDWGIPEDEANGSGSMKLALTLNRPLEIHHGQGSIIYTKPLSSGLIAVGGRVSGKGELL